MYIRKATMKSFIVLDADWTGNITQKLIKKIKPSHVIVKAREIPDEYFLFKDADILAHLKKQVLSQPLQEILGLIEDNATQVMDAYTRAEIGDIEEKVVITDEGKLIGFFDPSVPFRRRILKFVDATKEEGLRFNIEVRFPESITKGEDAELEFRIETDTPQQCAHLVGTKIDIVIQPQKGFSKIKKKDEVYSTNKTLTLSDDQKLSTAKVILNTTKDGPGKINIHAFYSGSCVGEITIVPHITPKEDKRRKVDKVPQVLSIAEEMINRIQQSGTAVMSLTIYEEEYQGRPHLRVQLINSNIANVGPHVRCTPKDFGDLDAYLRKFYSEIEGLDFSNDRKMTFATERIKSKGVSLYSKVVPDKLKKILWKHRDDIRSIHIYSNSPRIPWEMMRLHGTENGNRIVDEQYFGERFILTRWISPDNTSMLTENPSLNKLGIVAPELVEDEQSKKLHIKEEKKNLKELGAQNRKMKVEVVDTDLIKLMDAMKKAKYQSWHFSSHGAFDERDADSSSFDLGGGIKIAPDMIDGDVENIGNTKPLVFMNTCQSSRAGRSFGDVGGWAKAFLDAGASAFIGSYWSIYSGAALEFSTSFYSNLLNNQTIGEAVRNARLKAAEIPDPLTWLSYTVFANPSARLVL